MQSKLFAFQLAKPTTSADNEPIIGLYDPQAQAMVWQGGDQSYAGPLSSLYCTGTGGTVGYGSCWMSGPICYHTNDMHQYGYYCDQ